MIETKVNNHNEGFKNTFERNNVDNIISQGEADSLKDGPSYFNHDNTAL